MANPLMGTMVNVPVQAGQVLDMNFIKQAAQSAKQVMGTLQALKNPQQAFIQIAQQDPQINTTLQMLGGRNPIDIAREECQKCGMNFDELVSQFSN